MLLADVQVPEEAATPLLEVGVIPALVSLGVALIVTAFGWWLNLLQQRRDERVKLFADAFAVVQGYKEYPFVIRRRDASSPADERRRITAELTGLQRDISFSTAWVQTIDPRAGKAYRHLVDEARRVAGRLMHEAWQAAPVTSDDQMNVADVAEQLQELNPAESNYLAAVRRALYRWRPWRW